MPLFHLVQGADGDKGPGFGQTASYHRAKATTKRAQPRESTEAIYSKGRPIILVAACTPVLREDARVVPLSLIHPFHVAVVCACVFPHLALCMCMWVLTYAAWVDMPPPPRSRTMLPPAVYSTPPGSLSQPKEAAAKQSSRMTMC